MKDSLKSKHMTSNSFDDLEVMRIIDELIGMRAERDEANYRNNKAQAELAAIKDSWTWATGRFVLAPARLARRLSARLRR